MSIVDFAMNLTGWIESLMFFMLFDAFMERRIPFSPWRYGMNRHCFIGRLNMAC